MGCFKTYCNTCCVKTSKPIAFIVFVLNTFFWGLGTLLASCCCKPGQPDQRKKNTYIGLIQFIVGLGSLGLYFAHLP